VIDANRTALEIFDVDLIEKCEFSLREKVSLAALETAQDAAGMLLWLAALAKDVPRKWAKEYAAEGR